MSRNTLRKLKRQTGRPGGRLLSLWVIFVLLFTCMCFTGCGDEEEQSDSGAAPEQHISSTDDAKDKSSKKETKEKAEDSKDKKSKKEKEKNAAAGNGGTKKSDPGNTSSGKVSQKDGDHKEKAGSSSDKNSARRENKKNGKKNRKAKYCYFSVTCHTLTAIKDELPGSLQKLVPDSGVIVKRTKVKLKGGENAFDITKKVLRKKKIHISYQGTTRYGTAYIEAINNIYEKDVNSRSGWIYKVNGKTPGVGCSAYSVGKNDVIEWAYTCDLGEDL